MRNFILGFLLGVLSLYGALHAHVVRTDEGFHFVPKATITLRDTYVDLRAWDAEEWTKHPGFADSIGKAKRTDLLKSAAKNSLTETFNSIIGGKPRSEKTGE